MPVPLPASTGANGTGSSFHDGTRPPEVGGQNNALAPQGEPRIKLEPRDLETGGLIDVDGGWRPAGFSAGGHLSSSSNVVLPASVNLSQTTTTSSMSISSASTSQPSAPTAVRVKQEEVDAEDVKPDINALNRQLQTLKEREGALERQLAHSGNAGRLLDSQLRSPSAIASGAKGEVQVVGTNQALKRGKKGKNVTPSVVKIEEDGAVTTDFLSQNLLPASIARVHGPSNLASSGFPAAAAPIDATGDSRGESAAQPEALEDPMPSQLTVPGFVLTQRGAETLAILDQVFNVSEEFALEWALPSSTTG